MVKITQKTITPCACYIHKQLQGMKLNKNGECWKTPVHSFDFNQSYPFSFNSTCRVFLKMLWMAEYVNYISSHLGFYSFLVNRYSILPPDIYVFIVHYVYWVYVCEFCTLSSVQCVNMYCPYVNCCFLHCLEHAHKNFTHQGTCAVVMWQ